MKLKRLLGSAFRQIQHAGRRAMVFPQDAELALFDLPEADPAGPIVRDNLTLIVWEASPALACR
ncbi:hypothetical protein FRX94_05730 [Corynebacterium canis]|uniref:Uncharacterized protein n=1 Tax=Corynebacterium canis TaxID=679663 RepID=A0A5C5UIG4_9CORY|nr:hypothetical protein [Corynebacterium canis]TWT25627.1 hypothetical protein FRX94_05730 [Corynebacterium canis]